MGKLTIQIDIEDPKIIRAVLSRVRGMKWKSIKDRQVVISHLGGLVMDSAKKDKNIFKKSININIERENGNGY